MGFKRSWNGGEGGILNQVLELSRHVFSNMRKPRQGLLA